MPHEESAGRHIITDKGGNVLGAVGKIKAPASKKGTNLRQNRMVQKRKNDGWESFLLWFTPEQAAIIKALLVPDGTDEVGTVTFIPRDSLEGKAAMMARALIIGLRFMANSGRPKEARAPKILHMQSQTDHGSRTIAISLCGRSLKPRAMVAFPNKVTCKCCLADRSRRQLPALYFDWAEFWTRKGGGHLWMFWRANLEIAMCVNLDSWPIGGNHG